MNLELNPQMKIVKAQLEACGVKVTEHGESYIIQASLSDVNLAVFVENDEDTFRVSAERCGERVGFRTIEAETTNDIYRAIRLALSMYEKFN